MRAALKPPLFALLRSLSLASEDVPARKRRELRRHFGARLYLLTEADY